MNYLCVRRCSTFVSSLGLVYHGVVAAVESVIEIVGEMLFFPLDS